jgi:biopolymer transport protein ExbD
MKSRFRPKVALDNTIPLASTADIVFLLLIFFLLMSTFAKDTGLDVTLPRAQTSQEVPKSDIAIWITRTGQVNINGHVVPNDPPQIVAELQKAFRDVTAKSVTIRGDEGVPYGDVIRVMDVAKQNGAAITLAAVYDETGKPLPVGRELSVRR